jgi:hypothetical protein
MSNDINVKTIRFPVKTGEKLQSLANKSGLTKLDFFVHMVDYFYKSKKDPRDLNDELLKNAINKKTDNIIAFIRTQEGELLIPLKKESERMITAQESIINFFNNHVIGFNEDQRKVAQLQTNNINKILELLKKQDEMQYDKKILKNRFLELLDFYIRNREQMNMLTKQQEKDELIKSVREQLRYL